MKTGKLIYSQELISEGILHISNGYFYVYLYTKDELEIRIKLNLN
jgi:hypothetical protein